DRLSQPRLAARSRRQRAQRARARGHSRVGAEGEMSDKQFHLFVRTHAAGVSAQVITQPHLSSFAPDLSAARTDLSHVLEKLLVRGELWGEKTHYPDARLRKVDLPIRALQHGRLLQVPMRFSVLTWGAKKSERGPLEVLVPRLELSGSLDHAAD